MPDLVPGYKTNLGSDIRRDGMYLELIDLETEDEVAEVFYADEEKKLQISIFRNDMPLEVIEAFIAKAKQEFPAITS